MNVEWRQAAADPRPSQTTWAVSPLVQPARNYTHHRHLLLLSPKADSHFTVPQRAEGWVDLAGYIPRWFTRPQTVTRPDTNRVWRSATTLIEANALPLSQSANNYSVQYSVVWCDAQFIIAKLTVIVITQYKASIPDITKF